MNRILTGEIRCAELCKPVRSAVINELSIEGDVLNSYNVDESGIYSFNCSEETASFEISSEGFISKRYREELPELVRMLGIGLIGYQNSLSFSPGEDVSVCVNSSESYTAKLYRHGITKELVIELGIFSTSIQEVPDGHFVDKGLTWKESFSYRIPVEVRPGIYSLLLENSSGELFAMPFIVSSRRKQENKVLVLASTNNWMTYNIWGGRSRYRNNECASSNDFMEPPQDVKQRLIQLVKLLLPTPVKSALISLVESISPPAPWKFQPLSLERPFTNCLLEGTDPYEPFTNHLAAGEWRVIAWLEREGIDYDIVSGDELHRDENIVEGYSALVLSTHSEYWSQEMYEQVKYYHENESLWLINLSGNTMFRQIDFNDDLSIQCTGLRFQYSCADETQLFGVRFSDVDYGTAAPFRTKQSGHWAFADLNINDHDEFGARSLNRMTESKSNRYDPGRPGVKNGLIGNGASGWETDKLSKAAPKDFCLIAKGSNSWGGADMVVREPKGNRGGVFSASSITFGGSLLIDDICSGVVKNIFKKVLTKEKNYSR